MDLIHYWHCTGGYCNAGELYKHSLDAAMGRSTRHVNVKLMKQIAKFLCQMEHYEVAQELLVSVYIITSCTALS